MIPIKIMLKGKRRKTLSSFGPDGRRLGGNGLGVPTSLSRKRPLGASRPPSGESSFAPSSDRSWSGIGSSSYAPLTVPAPTFGKKRGIIQRAPIMCGLNVMVGSAGLLKPFQRPKLGRRAYKGKEDELLKKASLGARRSMGGMQRLLSRAGKGLNYLGKRPRKSEGGNTDESTDDEDEKEEDRPFEPLMVWNSPFQGGEAKGLPPTM